MDAGHGHCLSSFSQRSFSRWWILSSKTKHAVSRRGAVLHGILGITGGAFITTLIPHLLEWSGRDSALDGPTALAAYRGGFLISDEYNYRVRWVGPDGIISTVAGNGQDIGPGVGGGPTGDGGPALQARISRPEALAVLPDGGFVVSDAESVIRRVDAHGIITRLAGTGTAGDSGDGGPAIAAEIYAFALAATPDGGVLIGGPDALRRVAPDGTITTVPGRFAGVFGVQALPDGGYLVAESYRHAVRRVGSDGRISTLYGPGAFRDFAGRGFYSAAPSSLATSPEGLLVTRARRAAGARAIVHATGGPHRRDACFGHAPRCDGLHADWRHRDRRRLRPEPESCPLDRGPRHRGATAAQARDPAQARRLHREGRRRDRNRDGRQPGQTRARRRPGWIATSSRPPVRRAELRHPVSRAVRANQRAPRRLRRHGQPTALRLRDRGDPPRQRTAVGPVLPLRERPAVSRTSGLSDHGNAAALQRLLLMPRSPKPPST